MPGIDPISLTNHVLDIRADGSVAARATNPGPPERTDAFTVGLVNMAGQSPHNGEMHPDGDEILIVVEGSIRVFCDSQTESFTVGAGSACIVPKGEWHKLESDGAKLVHITPGPNGEVRFK